jgi:hypothetical protein
LSFKPVLCVQVDKYTVIRRVVWADRVHQNIPSSRRKVRGKEIPIRERSLRVNQIYRNIIRLHPDILTIVQIVKELEKIID